MYDMVNCFHLSCLEKEGFSTVAHFLTAHSYACWENLVDVFAFWSFRGNSLVSRLHSNLFAISSISQEVRHLYQGLHQVSGQS